MKALKIILTQNQANYRKEETSTNKTTYPLPPFSTVIGAIHNACGFTEYKPMNISIQGKFGAMQKEPYVNHTFFNSFQNDRGILIKLNNKNLHSSGFKKVAEALKNQGNDFEKEITIRVVNRELLDEFKLLKGNKREKEEEKKDDVVLDNLIKKIKDLKAEQKQLDKKSDEFLQLKDEIKKYETEKKEIETKYKTEIAEIDEELSKFATMVTSIKYYEVLYEVKLVLHIQAEDDVLDTIEKNIHNLRSIGRSEDFVDVLECRQVEIFDDIDKLEIKECGTDYTAYVKTENIVNEVILPKLDGTGNRGTKYYLNKNYIIENKKRIFEKYWVAYLDKFKIDYESELGEEAGVYIDEDKEIVNFI